MDLALEGRDKGETVCVEKSAFQWQGLRVGQLGAWRLSPQYQVPTHRGSFNLHSVGPGVTSKFVVRLMLQSLAQSLIGSPGTLNANCYSLGPSGDW